VAKTRLRLFATLRTGTRPLFLQEFRGRPVARAINPDQSVKPGYKKGMAPSKRWCFFGMVTPNPHARQNSPSGLNCKPDLPLHDSETTPRLGKRIHDSLMAINPEVPGLTYSKSRLAFFVRMHPNVRRDLPFLRELDHVHPAVSSAASAPLIGRLLRKRPGLFRRPDAGIDRRSCGASIGAKKVAGRMYPFGPEGPGAAVPGPLLFCRNASRFRA
jgi:hypothetical protein